MVTPIVQGESHLCVHEAKWFAVYTRFKREKYVCEQLRNKGIECYIPLDKRIRIYGRKKTTVELPLINCYVFVKITKSEYISVLDTVGVVSFLKFANRIISIPEMEIITLRKVVGEFQEIDVLSQSEFENGDTVEIISGSLAGTKGILAEKENKHSFIVSFENIGIQLSVKVDPRILSKHFSTRPHSDSQINKAS